MQDSFPRGGGISTTTNGSQKRGRNDTSEDGLFGSKRLRKIEIVQSKKKLPGNKKSAKGKQQKQSSSGTEKQTLSNIASIGLGMVTSAGTAAIGRIEKISFKKYSTGTLALGYILQVYTRHLLVSLPGGFTGTVEAPDISDHFHQVHESRNKTEIAKLPALTDILTAWQPIRCYVHGITASSSSKSDKSFIKLSLRSSLINKGLALKHLMTGFLISGCVASIEDHGYLITSGINGVTCFLQSKGLPASLGQLQLGQIVDCVVDDVNEVSRTVTLRAQKKSVSEAIIQSSALAFFALHPGMMFNAVVDKVVENGLIVSFLGNFSGVIDCLSLLYPMPISMMKSKYSAGEVVIARVVFVDHAAKSVRLSLRPHVIGFRAPKQLPALGEVLENMKIVVVQKQDGVLLSPHIDDMEEDESIADASENEDQYYMESNPVPISRRKAAVLQAKKEAEKVESIIGVSIYKKKLMNPSSGELVDEHDSMHKIFKAGMMLDKVRVLGYHLVEGYVSGSNVTHLVDENQILHISNVTIGNMYQAEITAVRPDGLVLLLEKRLPAFCPSLHLSDAGIVTKLTKLYRVGQPLSIRVWDIDESNAIIASCKKSVLQEDSTGLLTSYYDAIKGRIALGIVSKLSADDGIRIHFCNGIKGYIPNHILTKQGVFDLHQSYKVGQPVKCIILDRLESENIEHGKPKLLLAFNIGDVSDLLEHDVIQTDVDSDAMASSHETSSSNIASGYDMVSGHVIKMNDHELTLRLVDGRTAIINKYHCFDFASTADKLYATSFAVGTYIPRALILSSTPKQIIASMKPLLLKVSCIMKEDHSIETPIPNNISDITTGQVVAGWVYKVESYGVLIRFRGTFTALAPRTCLADKFVSSPVGMFTVGDAVRCVIQRIEVADARVIVMLKPSIIPAAIKELNYTSSYLHERYMVAREVAKQSVKILPDYKKYPIGSIIQAKVLSVKEYGVIFLGDDNVTVMMTANLSHVDDISSIKVDNIMSVRVLDIDYENNCLQVSCLSYLIISPSTSKNAVKTDVMISAVEDNTKLSGKIEVIHDKYLLVSVQSNKHHHLVYVSNADYHAPYVTTSHYELHRMIDIYVDIKPHIPDIDDDHHNPYYHVYFGLIDSSSSSSSHESQLKQLVKIQQDAKSSSSIDYGKLHIGAIIPWDIIKISPLEVKLVPAIKNDTMKHFDMISGILHVSCAIDQTTGCDDINSSSPSDVHPFKHLEVGHRIHCRIMKVQMISNKKSDNHHDDEHRIRSDSIMSEASIESSHDDAHMNGADNSKHSIVVYVSTVPDKMSSSDNKDDEDEVHDHDQLSKHRRAMRPLVQWQAIGKIQLHHIYASVVTKVDKFFCVVAISPYITAKLCYMDISHDHAIIQHFMNHCAVGQRVLVLVTDIDNKHRKIRVSRVDIEDVVSKPYDEHSTMNLNKQSKWTSPSSSSSDGNIMYGLLDLQAKAYNAPAAIVHLPHDRIGCVCITEINDPVDWKDEYTTINTSACHHITNTTTSSSKNKKKQQKKDVSLSHGQIISCICLPTTDKTSSSSSDMKASFDLSLRPSRIAGNMIHDDEMPADGSIVKGYVINISSKGCFIRLSRHIVGHVLMRDLSDTFIQQPEKIYHPGTMITARVLSSNQHDMKCQLSLKQSAIEGNTKIIREISKLHVHQVVVGSVHKVTEFGVFIAINNTSLIGLSRVADAISGSAGVAIGHDLRKAYAVGDIVRAKILSITLGTNKISLGLKPSYFDDCEDMEENIEVEDIDEVDDKMDEDDDEEHDEVVEELPVYVEEIAPSSKSKRKLDAVPVVEPLQVVSKKSKAIDVKQPSTNKSNLKLASNPPPTTLLSMITPSIEWDDFAPAPIMSSPTLHDDAMDEADEEDDHHSQSTSKSNHRTRQKDAQRRREEESIRQREEALSSDNFIPEGKNDYERLLIAQPNSSFLWIKYMAYYLSSADYLQAKAIAERALQTINFREEDEKFNIWMAWMNMEYQFGNQESIETVYKRAINESKGKYIHLKLAENFEHDHKYDHAEDILNKALKKYKYSKKVWMAYQHYHLRRGNLVEAKALLTRSMQSLEKHKHVEVIMKFALSEYDHNFMIDGRYLMEELLTSYPKRSDIWHVYVDREIKCGDVTYARQIFERMLGCKTSVRNMKVVFKKYLEFEQNHGTITSQEAVKQKARDYVEKMM